jgi:UDP-galactopyranose mutase
LKNIYIVGVDFLRSVIAERITSVFKVPATVYEKRDHIGGNCDSETNKETGIKHPKYGPYIFHTSNRLLWDYSKGIESI